jgi:uncharacterized protein
VRRILAATKSQLEKLIGDTCVLHQLEPEAFTDAVFGIPTVTDILRELEKPDAIRARLSRRRGFERGWKSSRI